VSGITKSNLIPIRKASENEQPLSISNTGFGECFTFDKENPEEGIARSESFVKKVYQRYGFKIIEPIHYSNWDKNNKPDHDVIIVQSIK
jgi:hypothetical protein